MKQSGGRKTLQFLWIHVSLCREFYFPFHVLFYFFPFFILQVWKNYNFSLTLNARFKDEPFRSLPSSAWHCSRQHSASHQLLAVGHCFLWFGEVEFPHILFFHLFFTLLPCTGCHILSLSTENNNWKKSTFHIWEAVPFIAFFHFFHDSVSGAELHTASKSTFMYLCRETFPQPL